METIKQIAAFCIEHWELLLAGAVLFLIAIGKGREAQQFLDMVANARDMLKGLDAAGDGHFLTAATIKNNALKGLAENSKLTYAQLSNVVKIKGSEIDVNKPALAVALLKSGDGKKAQRKVKKWFKKIF